jgi:hypothetical protein
MVVSNCEAGQTLVLGAGVGAKVMGGMGRDQDRDLAGFRNAMGYG